MPPSQPGCAKLVSASLPGHLSAGCPWNNGRHQGNGTPRATSPEFPALQSACVQSALFTLYTSSWDSFVTLWIHALDTYLTTHPHRLLTPPRQPSPGAPAESQHRLCRQNGFAVLVQGKISVSSTKYLAITTRAMTRQEFGLQTQRGV